MQLPSVETVKTLIRFDGDHEDARIELEINAAWAYASRFIGEESTAEVDALAQMPSDLLRALALLVQANMDHTGSEEGARIREVANDQLMMFRGHG